MTGKHFYLNKIYILAIVFEYKVFILRNYVFFFDSAPVSIKMRNNSACQSMASRNVSRAFLKCACCHLNWIHQYANTHCRLSRQHMYCQVHWAWLAGPTQFHGSGFSSSCCAGSFPSTNGPTEFCITGILLSSFFLHSVLALFYFILPP